MESPSHCPQFGTLGRWVNIQRCENTATSFSAFQLLFDREARAQGSERSHAPFRLRFRFAFHQFRRNTFAPTTWITKPWQYERFSWSFNENHEADDINTVMMTVFVSEQENGKDRLPSHVIKRYELWELAVRVRARFRSDSLFTDRWNAAACSPMRLRDFRYRGKTIMAVQQARSNHATHRKKSWSWTEIASFHYFANP